MHYEDLPEWSKRAADWAAEYHRTLRERPVRSRHKPGEFLEQIPDQPPLEPESVETVFEDFRQLVPDGMTHWQHPRFFAYFSSNASAASMLAEQLANALSAQCMLWQTSPAATELETAMMRWFTEAVGLPSRFRGVIQDTASTATLSAVLTMRELALKWQGNQSGLAGTQPLRIYASGQTHSSIDKAVRLAGIGQDNLVKVPCNERWEMIPEALQAAIDADRAQDRIPAGVIGCIGGTSIGASDRLTPILEIAKREQLYSHVDAAWAGAAMVCPELREQWAGIELADSIVINPHKWLGANFDCSIQLLADPTHQVKTLGMKPEYLKTLEADEITDYSEWCIPLGRRFRALKLWFLFRVYGLEGLRQRIRHHLRWAEKVAQQIEQWDDFEVVTPTIFSLFTFRWKPDGLDPEQATQKLIETINQDGRIYLTQTRHEGRFVIRFTVGQFEATEADVDMAITVIREVADELRSLSG